MRTPDQDNLPGDGDPSHTVGEGFGGVSPNEIDSYGEDFYDYDDTYEDEDSDDDFGQSDSDSDSDSVDVDDLPTDGSMTEDEAEDVLEDVLEESYGDEADEVAQDLQEDSGMSAIEILEDLTGLDLDGSEDDSASYAGDFDRQMLEAAEADEAASPTTSELFNEDTPSESDFDLDLDGVHDGSPDDSAPLRSLEHWLGDG